MIALSLFSFSCHLFYFFFFKEPTFGFNLVLSFEKKKIFCFLSQSFCALLLSLVCLEGKLFSCLMSVPFLLSNILLSHS